MIDNTMHTLAVKEFDFIAMSDEEMKLYPHLAKQVDNAEDDGTTDVPVEPEKPTDKPAVKPDEPTTDNNNNYVTDVVIPNTDSF